MNNKSRMLIFAAIFMLNSCSALYAKTQPKFAIIPTTDTAFFLPVNFTKTVKYQVTNRTNITRTLTMVPIAGITQVTGNGLCENPFTLAPNKTCLLSLQINGSQIPSRINIGPIICKTQGPGNSTPNHFLCSQPSRLNSLSITSTPQGQYAYVTNFIGNSISVCQVNPGTGFLENCNTTAGFANPEAVAMNPQGTLLFVANADPAKSSVSVCRVNSSTGIASECVNAEGGPFNAPSGVAVDPTGTILYVSNGFRDISSGVIMYSVSACDINPSTGVLSGCDNNPSPTFDNPFDMALNATGSFSYVVNYKSSTVSICQVLGKSVSKCIQELGNGLFNGPEGVTISPSGEYAYIANNGSNQVTRCRIHGESGLLLDCTITAGNFDGFGNVGFDNLGTSVYIPNFIGSRMFVCDASLTNGELSGCRSAHGEGFNGPSGVLLR